MAFINWDDSYSVNVAEIDGQHKKLVSMINELSDAMKEGRGKEVIGNTINGLVEYTALHFKCEEDYFDKFNYSEKGAHIEEHKDFVEKVVDFKDGFEKGKLSLSIEVLNFLKSWIQNHIKVSDKKYTKLLNDNGLR